MPVESESESGQTLPLISVIVPVHNGEATLKSCLEAIYRSDYPRIEVIVVDDLSSDSTPDIVEQFPCTLLRNSCKGGAAVARNTGAQKSRGEILIFIDSDVMIQTNSISKMAGKLLCNPEYSATFGSYTPWTKHTNFCSEYKNLVHHFTHQNGCEEASTFWSGCGAIRASAFLSVGGFNPADTVGADVEDIALGYRLQLGGHRIRLVKDVQVTHAKHYSFVGLLRSDIFHRAIPWTKLMIRHNIVRNDLNTRWENLLSALLVLAILASLSFSILSVTYLLPLVVMLAVFLYLNRKLLALFFGQNGAFFLFKAIPMTMLYYVYCVLGSALGMVEILIERKPVLDGMTVLPGKIREV